MINIMPQNTYVEQHELSQILREYAARGRRQSARTTLRG